VDELGAAALQVTPKDVYAAGFYPGAGLFQVIEHTVMDNPFAQLNHLNIKVIQLPELALGQNGNAGPALLCLTHTLLLDMLQHSWFIQGLTPKLSRFW